MVVLQWICSKCILKNKRRREHVHSVTERPFRSAYALVRRVFIFLFTMCLSFFLASVGKGVPCTMVYDVPGEHWKLLWVPTVGWPSEWWKAVVWESVPFLIEKEKEKRAIYFRCGREKHLESFSHNKALLWHLGAFIQVKKEFGTFPPHSSGLEEKKQLKRQDYLICCFVLFTWSVVPVDVGWVLLEPTKGLDRGVIFSQVQGLLSNEEG